LSDPDDIDEVLRDFRRFTEREPEGPDVEESAFADMPQLETEDVNAPEDELILGDDYVTYLIFVKQRQIDDFLVFTEPERIEIKTDEFTVRKEFGTRVDHEDLRKTYANGVLSVRLRRLEARDAVG
jgi:hypothetical protein